MGSGLTLAGVEAARWERPPIDREEGCQTKGAASQDEHSPQEDAALASVYEDQRVEEQIEGGMNETVVTR